MIREAMIRITKAANATILGAIILVAAAPAAAQVVHEPFVPPVTAGKIRIAIDDAVMYLRNAQAADGSIMENYGGGSTALSALTMLAAGGHPATDESLNQALEYLEKLEPNNTYVRGIRANVWEYALRKAPYEKKYRTLLKADFDWLLQALGDKEGWRYNLQSGDWDNSCTQYGVLGIWAAARAGFDPGEKFWQTMSKHFRGCQNADGGWGYTTGGSSPNMATAGLASMFLVFDMSHGKTFYSPKNPRAFAEGDAADVLASIERGMGWLGKSQGSYSDSYYLYGIERAGVASGRKYIGGHDWFARGAQTVLQAQRQDGSIPLGRWGQGPVGTSLSTLFLVYGGAPVAFNKLEYGIGHDWNLNPRDLANLTKHLWGAYERPLNWQTVSIAAPAEEIEAPVLFISGSEAAEFSEEEMLKLREYIFRGGTILAEPSHHSAKFEKSMVELCRQMFPPTEYPDYQLQPLPADHGIYTVIKQDWQQRPKLRGLSNGSRTVFVLSDEYLSADWQMDRTDSDAFKLAMNLLFYATDLASLEGKFASMLPESAPAEARTAETRVARLRYTGDEQHPRDWDAANTLWNVYAPYATHVTGCPLKESVVRLEKDSLEGVQLLHVAGRHAFKLNEAEGEALKKYVEQGGTVLVEATAGSRTFAESARRQLEAIFGELAPLPADDVLSQGLFEGGADLSDGVRFKLKARQLLRNRGEEPRGQKLLAANVDGRPAVLFSEFDLSSAMAGVESYRALAYTPESARKIVGNILAYVMAD